MPDLTKDDIIITIVDKIRRKASHSQSDDFVIYIDPIESDNNLPKGSVLEHLEEAAEEANCSVVRKGSDRVSLRKKAPGVGVA